MLRKTRKAAQQVLAKAVEIVTPVPEPFLGDLFDPGVKPVIATGFFYHEQEIAIHGVKQHRAIDYDLPRGTKVLAPADGWYICSYGEVALRNDDGSQRQLSLEDAKRGNPRNTDLKPPEGKGPWPIWFGGFLVQGFHGQGLYTQYNHLDWVSPKIRWHGPSEQENGDFKPSAMLRAPAKQYRAGRAVFLKTGELIGLVGMTGCGWGKRCWEYASFGKDGRPDFRHADYPHSYSWHLHFMVFRWLFKGSFVPEQRVVKAIDPYGIYGEYNDGYPKDRTEWHLRQPGAKHAPLFASQAV